jgi:hypothetical protein
MSQSKNGQRWYAYRVERVAVHWKSFIVIDLHRSERVIDFIAGVAGTKAARMAIEPATARSLTVAALRCVENESLRF